MLLRPYDQERRRQVGWCTYNIRWTEAHLSLHRPKHLPSNTKQQLLKLQALLQNLFSPVPAQAALHTKIQVYCRALVSLPDLPHLASPCPTCPGHDKHPAREPKSPKKKGGQSECLCSMHKTWFYPGSTEQTRLEAGATQACNPSTQEFKVILNYLMSLRPASPRVAAW